MNSIEDYDILRRFFDIFNEHQSQVTGWPMHRFVKTKKGGTRRWRLGRDRFEAWINKNFVETGLMKPYRHVWEWVGADWDKREYARLDDRSPRARYEEHFEGFYASDRGFTYAVRKDFALKVLALGHVSL
jgi:hypothetical protein